MPAWQKRQPRIQPRWISSTTRSWVALIKGTTGALRIIGVRHIHDDLFFDDSSGISGTYGGKGLRWCRPPYKSPHKGRERRSPEFLPRHGEILFWRWLFCLVFLIKVHQMEIFGLTFANIKKIKEIQPGAPGYRCRGRRRSRWGLPPYARKQAAECQRGPAPEGYWCSTSHTGS